jgi:hypothetical protein
VSSPPSPDPTVRFGEFAANLRAAELYRNGTKVKLQGQPFEVLALLLEHSRDPKDYVRCRPSADRGCATGSLGEGLTIGVS